MSEALGAIGGAELAAPVDDRLVYRWRRDANDDGWELVGPAGTICTVYRGTETGRQWWADMQFDGVRHAFTRSSRMKAHCDIERHLLTKTSFSRGCAIEWRAGGGR